MEDENNSNSENNVFTRLLCNVPSPELMKNAISDFVVLMEYSKAIVAIQQLAELSNKSLEITPQEEFCIALQAAYTMGYRKGKAATPLTLVVAPDEESL